MYTLHMEDIQTVKVDVSWLPNNEVNMKNNQIQSLLQF